MLARCTPALLALPLLAAAPAQQGDPLRSVYTTLDPAQCRTIRTYEETGDSEQRCPGIAGHVLLVSDGDARVSVTVVTPDRRQHPLDYWTVITSGFSSLGPRAEWRVRGTGRALRPVALIVRVNANEDPEVPERRTSYLAVARLTGGRVCVTHRIGPYANANELARQAADRAGTLPCLGPRQ
jgi:hypothetical protein